MHLRDGRFDGPSHRFEQHNCRYASATCLFFLAYLIFIFSLKSGKVRMLEELCV